MVNTPSNASQDGSQPSSALPEALMIWTSFLLHQAAQRAEEQTSAALVPLHLRPALHAALIVLADGPLSQVGLATLLQTDRTTIVGMVDELEHKGLVRRQRNARDRRAYDLLLTDAGKAFVDQARSAMTAADKAFSAALSAAEVEQLRTLLRRLIQSYDALRAQS